MLSCKVKRTLGPNLGAQRILGFISRIIARLSQTYAKEACGATNASRFPFTLPKILAVRLLLPLCTSRLISSRRTSSARPLVLIWAFTDGQIARTKASKLLPSMMGLAYKKGVEDRYHVLATRVDAWRVGWSLTWENMLWRISGGSILL